MHTRSAELLKFQGLGLRWGSMCESFVTALSCELDSVKGLPGYLSGAQHATPNVSFDADPALCLDRRTTRMARTPMRTMASSLTVSWHARALPLSPSSRGRRRGSMPHRLLLSLEGRSALHEALNLRARAWQQQACRPWVYGME